MPVHSENSQFSPGRLAAARLRRGMTIERLSKLMGVERHAISRYEAGLFAPNAGHLTAMARTLVFPQAFFFGDDIGELSRETVSFRSASKRTARQCDKALGSAAVAVVLNQVIEQLYALPEMALPALPKQTSPERAASIVRMKWHLDDKPVKSMVQILESKGVRIFSLPADAAPIDTFSLWHQDRPFVLLNTRKAEDELRLDAAHELGHLLLHRHASPAGRQAHGMAASFASAFLMPAEASRADVQSSVGTNDPSGLSTKWGVPPAALAYRLHKLGLLSDWKYRELCTNIARQSGVTTNKGAGTHESSQLLQSAFGTLRAQGITKRKLTSTFHIYLEDIDALTFGLATAMFSYQPDVQADAERLPPRLRIVSSA